MAQDDFRQSLLSPSTPSASLNANKNSNMLRRKHPGSYRAPATNETGCLLPNEPLGSSFRKVLILLGAYLGIGSVTFFLVRNQIEGKKTDGFIDSLYFCIVTMTTVGYGDLVPRTTLAKFLASVYVFAGMTIAGLFLGKAADRIVENQEALLVRAITMNEKLSSSKVVREVQRHELKCKLVMAVLMLVMLVAVGTAVISKIENLGFTDSLYCVCCTITTLGYGDKSFSTKSGRGFAVFWMLSSSVCLAQCLCYIAELQAETRQRELVKWVMSRKLTSSELEAADLDLDDAVSAAEFILYKLKEMGKIKDDDISNLMENFRNLDADHSGTLTSEDLRL